MWFIRELLVGGSLLTLLVSPANAQVSLADLQAKLVGTWVTTVEGETRTRNFVIDTVAQKTDGSYSMAGSFNLSGDKTYPFKDGTVQVSSGNATLDFTSVSGLVYTVTAKPDGTLSGNTKYTNGQVKSVTMVKGAVPVVAASATDPAAATSTFLKKDELEKLVMGKDMLLRSKSSGDEIVWAIKSDGNLYGENHSTNQRDAATWKIRDDGALCVEWRGGSNNSCSFFNRQGDKYTLHRSKKNPATMDVISIK